MITLTPISESSAVSVSLVQSSAGQTVSAGTPIGLLLALTYAANVSADALTVTLISKS